MNSTEERADQRFSLNIKLGNAAFDNPLHLSELVSKVSDDLRCAKQNGRVMDINGNHVGDFAITKDPKVETDIQVQRMYRFETDRPLKAFVDIVINDCLLIKGVRVMDGSKGLFVSMPREQAKDQKWYDTIRCLTQEIRDQITEVVLAAYKED